MSKHGIALNISDITSAAIPVNCRIDFRRANLRFFDNPALANISSFTFTCTRVSFAIGSPITPPHIHINFAG
jgi:hypothetical protein